MREVEGGSVDENQVNERWKLFEMVRRESFGMQSVIELLYILPQECFHDTTVPRLIISQSFLQAALAKEFKLSYNGI